MKNPWRVVAVSALLVFTLLLTGLFLWRNRDNDLQIEVTKLPELTEATAAFVFPVNINQATAEVLEQLPGIGPVLAEQIVETRRVNGGFATIDELLEISGIGEKTLEGLRDYVTVGD